MNRYKEGLKDGIAIGLGYLSVSFTFGMMAVAGGMPIWAAVVISLTNLTSAGQFAGLELILIQSSYIEMAFTQLIINLRYALMSLSLSQKIEKNMSGIQRGIIAYGITDEIFALASSKQGKVGTSYMLGLMTLPILCWTGGTLLGGIANELLPVMIRDALGIAIYGMFLAIILPPARKQHSVKAVLVIAIAMSCILSFTTISSGFSVIICTLAAAGLGAVCFPIKEVSHE